MFLEIITFSDSEIIDRMQYPTLYAILANTIARRHQIMEVNSLARFKKASFRPYQRFIMAIRRSEHESK